MEVIKEKEWKTRFNELPVLLKIVVAWVYLISVVYFLKFFIVFVFQLSLDPFSLAFGYLIWVLAGGLLDRSNLARIIALVFLGVSTVIAVYIVWHGGTVSLDRLTMSASYPGSIIWIVASGGSTLILLLPQVRRSFRKSIQEEITQ